MNMRGEIEVQVREMLLQRGEDYFAWPNSPWEVASEPEVLVSGMVAPESNVSVKSIPSW